MLTEIFMKVISPKIIDKVRVSKSTLTVSLHHIKATGSTIAQLKRVNSNIPTETSTMAVT